MWWTIGLTLAGVEVGSWLGAVRGYLRGWDAGHTQAIREVSSW